MASAMFCPCETRTSTCRNFATISSGLCCFLGILVLLDAKRHTSGRTTSRGEDQSGGPANGGFENHEWAAVVGRDGIVCAVVFSGDQVADQWPGSRAIAMENATTANAFSLKGMALSTANLLALAQPGQSLYGIITASPPSPDGANGDPAQFGTPSDPMTGKRMGGVIVFGGGLALYKDNDVVGGLGVSGDSACADHNVAWRIRKALGLDNLPAGPSSERKDA